MMSQLNYQWVMLMNENRLEGLREEKDLKGKEVAHFLKVSPSVYSEWENNRSRIPTKRLIELADYYEVSIDYIVRRTNKRNKVSNSIINLEKIGKRLKEIRLEQKYSLRELGDKVDMAFSSLSNYENGKLLIQSDILLEICNMDNYSIDYVLGRSKNKYIDK